MTKFAVSYRRYAVRWWWQLDRAANQATTWTGRRVAAAYDRLVATEDERH